YFFYYLCFFLFYFICFYFFFFFFSSRRRHTRSDPDCSSDVCSSDLALRLEDLVLPQPLVVEDLRQIPLSGVGQHGHHERLGIVHPTRHVERSHDVDAGRASGEQGLFLGQAPHHQHGVLVGHRDPLVDHVPVQRGRQFVAADTLHLVGVALGLLMGTRVLGVDRADRLAGDHADPWVLLLEEPTRPAHRTASPR